MEEIREKTLLDPSPYGWRMNWGRGNEFAQTDSLKKIWKQALYEPTKMQGGSFIDNKFWFPASGSHDYIYNGNNHIYNWLGKCGAYWTGGRTPWDTHGSLMYFEYMKGTWTKYNVDYYIARSYACAVRPVLDE